MAQHKQLTGRQGQRGKAMYHEIIDNMFLAYVFSFVLALFGLMGGAAVQSAPVVHACAAALVVLFFSGLVGWALNAIFETISNQ